MKSLNRFLKRIGFFFRPDFAARGVVLTLKSVHGRNKPVELLLKPPPLFFVSEGWCLPGCCSLGHNSRLFDFNPSDGIDLRLKQAKCDQTSCDHSELHSPAAAVVFENMTL